MNSKTTYSTVPSLIGIRKGSRHTPSYASSWERYRSPKQYLTPSEEKALAEYVLRMAERGYPVPVKLLRYLAWVIVRQRPLPSRSLRTMMGSGPLTKIGP
jgi:hypothetical protein